MADYTTVFLSSTAKDLQPWRKEVAKTIRKASGFNLSQMEDFGAVDAIPADLCRRKVAASDIFVGLIGVFNGSCPEGSDLSYTQIEYEEAKKRNKPCLMFMTDGEFSPPYRLGREPDTLYQRQVHFREKVGRERVVGLFHDPKELAVLVATALLNHQADQTSKTGGEKTAKSVVKPSRGPADLAKAEALYLTLLTDHYRYLDFKGMGASDHLPLKLLDIYVSPKARLRTPDGETWSRHARMPAEAAEDGGFAERFVNEKKVEDIAERLGKSYPVLDLLQRTSGLILLGDPGSGKTSFLKYLAIALASGKESIPGLGHYLPILVPVSAYADAVTNRNRSFERFLFRYLKDRELGLPINLVQEKLSRGEVLLLLDGLDEARKLTSRNIAVEGIKDFYHRHRKSGNKFVLTSRVVGYWEVRPAAEGLAEATLVDFEDGEIERFVERWAAALENAAVGKRLATRGEALRERKELLTAVRGNFGVRSLAGNPLLLTILVLMKRQGITLPERRVELYERYVEILIKHWNLNRGLAGRPEKVLELLGSLRILQPLALWMHETAPGVGRVRESDLHRELQHLFAQQKKRDPEKAAYYFLTDLRHTGLLLNLGGRQYGFIHLTLQEYLAAAALAQREGQMVEPIAAELASHVGEAPWREVSRLTLGYLALIKQQDQAAGAILGELLQLAPEPAGEAAILAGEALVDIGPGVIGSEHTQRVATALVETMRDDKRVNAIRRTAAGKMLAALGDPRFDPSFWWLPKESDLGFVEIPAGAFLMGSSSEDDSESYKDEWPRHSVTLPSFWLGRYLVTVGQYRTFVEMSGYHSSDARWHEGASTQPVVHVSWYDALAYCRWLGERLRDLAPYRAGETGSQLLWSGLASGKLRASLPSEAEWEKAARGVEGLAYPWGQQADASNANYHDTGLRERSVVGCFPGGTSSHGIEELSGNVSEWTRSLLRDYPYDPEGSRRELKASPEILRVLRGGSFVSYSRNLRCAFRDRFLPDYRDGNIGFRVVLSPFPL